MKTRTKHQRPTQRHKDAKKNNVLQMTLKPEEHFLLMSEKSGRIFRYLMKRFMESP